MSTQRGRSKKTPIIRHLFERWKNGEFPDGDIRRNDVKASMEAVGAKLSDGNIANFLKDLIRKKTVVENWPIELIQEGISARQRYGDERVLQFFEHPAEWDSPFPDWHAPTEATPVYTIQSLFVDSIARSLGRSEETWLTQIAVNLGIVQSQLSIFSDAHRRARIRDVRHLQMGIKTQPEIDAAFVATYSSESSPSGFETVFVTLEAKQRDERILIDQIREQVAKAFELTAHLDDPPIHAVKPLALQVADHEYQGATERMIFIVEFEQIAREEFLRNFSSEIDPLAKYEMMLEEVSSTLYRLEPPIPALG